MECCKWERVGLLYLSQELCELGNIWYEKHLKECPDCRKEFQFYQSDKQFFTLEILGEAPSTAVDMEILRVCSDPSPKIQMSVPIFRRILVPALLFIIGFVSVGYIKMNMENDRQTKVVIQSHNTVIDSTKDSIFNYAKTRGNLNDNGVLPVDLKK